MLTTANSGTDQSAVLTTPICTLSSPCCHSMLHSCCSPPKSVLLLHSVTVMLQQVRQWFGQLFSQRGGWTRVPTQEVEPTALGAPLIPSSSSASPPQHTAGSQSTGKHYGSHSNMAASISTQLSTASVTGASSIHGVAPCVLHGK